MLLWVMWYDTLVGWTIVKGDVDNRGDGGAMVCWWCG